MRPIPSRLVRLAAAVGAVWFLFLAGPAAAGPAPGQHRIGFLTAGSEKPFRQRLAAFRQQLDELGYREGKNLVIEDRYAGGHRKRLPALAAELVGLRIAVTVTNGGTATKLAVRSAKRAGKSIPVVFAIAPDPVGAGLVASLARPGGNVTGVFDLAPDLAGKRLELLRELFPRLSRVAHLSPGATPVGPAHFRAMQATADALGVQVRPITVQSPDALEQAFRTTAAENADALIVLGVSFFITHRASIVKLAAKYRLPVMYTNQHWVPHGGLIAYASDSGARFRRAAWYVDRILKGAKPADLPAEQPKKFLLEINLRTAKALGVPIPRSILLRADRVIE